MKVTGSEEENSRRGEVFGRYPIQFWLVSSKLFYGTFSLHCTDNSCIDVFYLMHFTNDGYYVLFVAQIV